MSSIFEFGVFNSLFFESVKNFDSAKKVQCLNRKLKKIERKLKKFLYGGELNVCL